MAVAALAVVGAVGAALSFKGEMDQADAKADQARAESDEMERQANELEQRNKIEADLLRRQGEQTMSEQQVVFSAAGLDISGAPLEIMHETQRRVNDEISLRSREASYEAGSLRRGAAANRSYAEKMRSGAMLGSVGSLLSSASSLSMSAYGASKK